MAGYGSTSVLLFPVYQYPLFPGITPLTRLIHLEASLGRPWLISFELKHKKRM